MLPASAVPTIAGVVDCAGDAGLVEASDGADGRTLSSTYTAEVLEHAEVASGASVAVAWNVVVELSATLAAIVNTPELSAVPVAIGKPVHEAFV